MFGLFILFLAMLVVWMLVDRQIKKDRESRDEIVAKIDANFKEMNRILDRMRDSK